MLDFSRNCPKKVRTAETCNQLPVQSVRTQMPDRRVLVGIDSSRRVCDSGDMSVQAGLFRVV